MFAIVTAAAWVAVCFSKHSFACFAGCASLGRGGVSRSTSQSGAGVRGVWREAAPRGTTSAVTWPASLTSESADQDIFSRKSVSIIRIQVDSLKLELSSCRSINHESAQLDEDAWGISDQ